MLHKGRHWDQFQGRVTGTAEDKNMSGGTFVPVAMQMGPKVLGCNVPLNSKRECHPDSQEFCKAL
jgi:hypothetical protein